LWKREKGKSVADLVAALSYGKSGQNLGRDERGL